MSYNPYPSSYPRLTISPSSYLSPPITSYPHHRLPSSNPYPSPTPSPSPPTHHYSSSTYHRSSPRHHRPPALPSLQPPPCSICARPTSSCNCEFASLVVLTETIEPHHIAPLLSTLRHRATSKAQAEVEGMWRDGVEREWGRIWAHGGGHTELQMFADAEWGRCVGTYEEVLGRAYGEVVSGVIGNLEIEEESGGGRGHRRRRGNRREREW